MALLVFAKCKSDAVVLDSFGFCSALFCFENQIVITMKD